MYWPYQSCAMASSIINCGVWNVEQVKAWCRPGGEAVAEQSWGARVQNGDLSLLSLFSWTLGALPTLLLIFISLKQGICCAPRPLGDWGGRYQIKCGAGNPGHILLHCLARGLSSSVLGCAQGIFGAPQRVFHVPVESCIFVGSSNAGGKIREQLCNKFWINERFPKRAKLQLRKFRCLWPESGSECAVDFKKGVWNGVWDLKCGNIAWFPVCPASLPAPLCIPVALWPSWPSSLLLSSLLIPNPSWFPESRTGLGWEES